MSVRFLSVGQYFIRLVRDDVTRNWFVPVADTLLVFGSVNLPVDHVTVKGKRVIAVDIEALETHSKRAVREAGRLIRAIIIK